MQKSDDKTLHELDEEQDTNRHLADLHGPNPSPKHGACPLCGAELDKTGYCYMCMSVTGKLIGENHEGGNIMKTNEFPSYEEIEKTD